MNMNKEQTEKALIILEHYGAGKQRRQLVEECAVVARVLIKSIKQKRRLKLYGIGEKWVYKHG